MFVSNGLLLSKENINSLQKLRYIFGISIDGNKKQHDTNRVDKLGVGTHNRIIKNIKKIKHREYLGAAVTLTGANTDLVKVYKHLYRYFGTISIKPVRDLSNTGIGINEKNIQKIIEGYNQLYDYLLRNTLKGKLNKLSVLLNGDDYFGKFILRVILNQKVLARCDAGSGRFSLFTDKNIYACPGSAGIKELMIGSLKEGLNKNKMDLLWREMYRKSECAECEAKYVCGGECLVVSYYKHNRIDRVDDVMCVLKRHLFKLAVKFKFSVLASSEELFCVLYEGCQKKINRFCEDKDLSRTLNESANKYTFMELKNIKDNDKEKYFKIKEDLL